MSTREVRFLGAAGAALLAACSGGYEDTPTAFCNSFGTGATFTWSCDAGCTPTNPASASDRDLYTAASITPNAGQTTETATLTATATVDFPSGATVGVWVTQPQFKTMINGFRTKLNGVDQESASGSELVVENAGAGTDAAGFIGMRTTKGFDVVEFTTTSTWNPGQTPVYFVYEICADGGNG